MQYKDRAPSTCHSCMSENLRSADCSLLGLCCLLPTPALPSLVPHLLFLATSRLEIKQTHRNTRPCSTLPCHFIYLLPVGRLFRLHPRSLVSFICSQTGCPQEDGCVHSQGRWPCCCSPCPAHTLTPWPPCLGRGLHFYKAR